MEKGLNLMFGLFKSKRNKIKEKGERTFNNFLPALKGMDASAIGFVLDGAVKVKHASTMFGTDQIALEIFRDPMMVPEDVAFKTLEEWEQHMMSLGGTIEGRSKVGSLSIWYLSVIACHIAELRLHGRELWGELERGFKHTEVFDPDEDTVVGLEPRFE